MSSGVVRVADVVRCDAGREPSRRRGGAAGRPSVPGSGRRRLRRSRVVRARERRLEPHQAARCAHDTSGWLKGDLPRHTTSSGLTHGPASTSLTTPGACRGAGATDRAADHPPPFVDDMSTTPDRRHHAERAWRLYIARELNSQRRPRRKCPCCGIWAQFDRRTAAEKTAGCRFRVDARRWQRHRP
jgi:hypothetical protein